MPTSGPGSNRVCGVCGVGRARRGPGARARRAGRGFTLIELLLVIAIIALSAGLLVLSLRDGDEARLEEEAARLSALLEMARAEARVAGATVRWVPGGIDADAEVQFRFIGLPLTRNMPTRWIDPATRAQVVGASTVLLGPEAILPPQRIVLTLAARRLELASDGLGPFAVPDGAAAP